jgi:trans-aconitate methyltransferase
MSTTNEKHLWDPSLYEENSSLQFKVALSMVQQHDFTGSEKILDLGFGNGKISNILAHSSHRGSVLGIDSSEDMLDYSQQKYAPVPNLNFELGDVQNLSFDKEFNLVTSFSCLHWPKDKLATFQGIFNALKPQGKALLAIPLPDENFFRTVNHVVNSKTWQIFFKEYQNPLDAMLDDDYVDYAEQAGFTVAQVNIKQWVEPFETREELNNWMAAVIPHLSSLIEEKQKAAFMEMIVSHYLELTQQEAGHYEILIPFIELELLKI